MKTTFLKTLFQSLLLSVLAFTSSCSKDGASPAKGTLSIYSYTLKNGYMDIYVDKYPDSEPTRHNTTLVSPFIPECGANTTTTFSLSAGTHTLYFNNGSNVYNQTYEVIADSCQLIKKNF